MFLPPGQQGGFMEKTICAISTGLTASGIIIVRMTGPEAITIADRLYRSPNKKKRLVNVKGHTLNYGFIYDGDTVVDEVLVGIMKAPYTFSGEDVAEINCHGGILVAKKVLELLTKNGAVLAEPGEFAKIAFLNGKMDLSKAEAVIDIIGAKNEFALQASVNQLKGTVSEKVRSLRETILDEISFIEAALDDPEHYDLDGYTDTLREKLMPLHEELDTLVKKADYGAVMKEGIRTVIAGRPNAGKSSLLNLLSGHEKAIVTEIAGTTRDVLEVPVTLGELTLILMDTAGIRNTEDIVEKIGVDRAKEALQSADLILYLVDRTEGILPEDEEILNSLTEKKVILLCNKSDLLDEDRLLPDTEKINIPGLTVLPFSAKTGMGLDRLEKMILGLYETSEVSYNDQVMITNVRHKNLLSEAENSIGLVIQGIEDGMPEDFLTIDLMNAYQSLGRIIGEDVGEDVINRIFEKFCMGK